MKTPIKTLKLIEKLSKMPYYKNDSATGGKDKYKHEDAVEKVVLSVGFKKSKTEKISKQQKENLMKNGHLDCSENPLLRDGEYISQPRGTQDRPDFIIKENGRVFFIECKSSKNKQPTYNSGLVCDHCIYVFCSEAENKTTIFLGGSVAGAETKKLMLEAQEKIREILVPINEKLGKTEDNQGGLIYYDRPMYSHKKTSMDFRVDYFEPDIVDSRYKEVVEYIKSL